ncbi:MAG: polysaccharide biosynthesis protein [Flavipsychrobacter sp.]|jgi:O-antigen/teichoic acid export membrane protein|nr:polysaccharide biosynthesis protein [Flavipsychrobacter sp.]
MKLNIAGNYWVNSGFFTLLKNLSNILLSFGGFYFLVRTLDKNTFGVWCLFMGTTTLIEFARNGLVSNAFLKYLSSAKKEDYSKIVSASFAVTGILTLVCIIINCILAKLLSRAWHMQEIEQLFYAFCVVFIVTGFTNQFNNLQQANLKFKGTYFSSLSGSVILFLYIFLSYIFKHSYSLISLVFVQFAAAVVSLVISYFYARSYLTYSGKVDRQWVKTLINYGKFTFGTIVSSIIFGNIDQWMLGYLISPVATGVYAIATRITSLVEVPTGTVATIVFPQSARRAATEGKEAAKELYEKSVGAILAILLPGLLVLYIFPDFFVNIIAGAKYADSVPILRIVVLYCLLMPYARQSGTILDSIGLPHINFYTVMFSALCNVFANYFFINRYGIIGAAYGTLFASLVNFCISQYFLTKYFGVNFLNTLKYAISFYPKTLVSLRAQA